MNRRRHRHSEYSLSLLRRRCESVRGGKVGEGVRFDKDKNSPTFTLASTQLGLNSELNPSEVFQPKGGKKVDMKNASEVIKSPLHV